jgi:hypothetical protein
MKKATIAGLAALLVTGCATQESIVTEESPKSNYMAGNVHGVDYSQVNQGNFNSFLLEKQNLFGEDYILWKNEAKENERNFSLSVDGKENYVYEVGGETSVEVDKYIPTKVSDTLKVHNLKPIDKTRSGLEERIGSEEYFGFSYVVDGDSLEFRIPKITIDSVGYMVLPKLDSKYKNKKKNSPEKNVLELYFLPYVKGTKIVLLNEPTLSDNGYTIDAEIYCPKTGGVYVPFLEGKGPKKEESNVTNIPVGITD